MSEAKRTKQTVLAIELDGDELACRILEGLSGKCRPPGTSAVEGLNMQKRTCEPLRYALQARQFSISRRREMAGCRYFRRGGGADVSTDSVKEVRIWLREWRHKP